MTKPIEDPRLVAARLLERIRDAEEELLILKSAYGLLVGDAEQAEIERLTQTSERVRQQSPNVKLGRHAYLIPESVTMEELEDDPLRSPVESRTPRERALDHLAASDNEKSVRRASYRLPDGPVLGVDDLNALPSTVESQARIEAIRQRVVDYREADIPSKKTPWWRR